MGWNPLTAKDKKNLVKRIKDIETHSNGSVKIHLDKWCKTNAQYKAQNVFVNLGMDKHSAANAVLIYVAVKERKLAIVGDVGFCAEVTKDYWQRLCDSMVDGIKTRGLLWALNVTLDEIELAYIKMKDQL